MATGTPAGHQANHLALTIAEASVAGRGPAKTPGRHRRGLAGTRHLIRMQYRSATPELVGRVRTLGHNARPHLAAQPELERIAAREQPATRIR